MDICTLEYAADRHSCRDFVHLHTNAIQAVADYASWILKLWLISCISYASRIIDHFFVLTV